MQDWNEGDHARWRGVVVEIVAIDREREVCTLRLAVSVAQLGDAAEIIASAPRGGIPLSELQPLA